MIPHHRSVIIEVFLNTDGGLLNVEELPKPLVVWGFVITHPNGNTLYEDCAVVERQGTSNEAEYLGVIHGLEACARLGATKVLLRVDSQLVARQLSGQYAVKSIGLKSYYKNAKRRAAGLDLRIKWVRREANRRADALCHQAMHLWRHQNGKPYKGKSKKGNPA